MVTLSMIFFSRYFTKNGPNISVIIFTLTTCRYLPNSKLNFPDTVAAFVMCVFVLLFLAIMMRVEDVIIKTIVSVEMPIASACKMFMPFRGNCFGKYLSSHPEPNRFVTNVSKHLLLL